MTRAARDPVAVTPFRWIRPLDEVHVGEVHGQEDDHGRRDLPSPELVLVEAQPFDERRVAVYEPLREVPDLAVQLANLPDDATAFAAFASRYGFLGDIWGTSDRVGGPSELEPGSASHAQGAAPPAIRGRGLPRSGWHRCAFELVSDWQLVTEQLRSVVGLRVALEERDRRRVEELVAIDDESATMEPWEVDFARLEAEGLGAELARNRLMFSGWCLLQQAVNFELARTTTTALVWEKALRGGRPALVPRTVVRNLAGAAWLQVANSFARTSPLRRCKAPKCCAFFYVPLDSRGKRDRYCAPKCRSAAYRQRKKKRERGRRAAPRGRV